MEESRHILQSGLQSLGLVNDEEKTDLLLAFLKLLEKWNKAYNLTAIRKRKEMVRLHLLDSLTILPYLHGPRIIDIGTGAGLPGIPLAIYCRDYHFVLLDSNAKKTRFVQQIVLELNLTNVEVCHRRVEDYTPPVLFDTVICRAFSNMREIIKLSGHLLTGNGLLLAMKGQHPGIELERLKQPFSIIPVTIPGVEAERCLIQVRKSI